MAHPSLDLYVQSVPHFIHCCVTNGNNMSQAPEQQLQADSCRAMWCINNKKLRDAPLATLNRTRGYAILKRVQHHHSCCNSECNKMTD